MFVSYAQNGEDIVLWRILKGVKAGTYVDVGAADPSESSVTRAFYDRGWSGVNVEPVPRLAMRLEEERPRDRTFCCAAGNRFEEVAFYIAEGTGLSTLDASLLPSILDLGYEVTQIPVSMRTLDDILAEADLHDHPIHFLKVDVEGAEAEVLAGLDLTRWRPWVVVVEATEPMSTAQNHELWEARVLASEYTFGLFDGLNRFYVANEHPELLPAALYPVCVFDYPYRSVLLDTNRESDRKLGEEAVASLASTRKELEDREAHVRDLTTALEESLTRSANLTVQVDAALADTLRWRREAARWRGQLAAANDSVRQAQRMAAEAAERATSEIANNAVVTETLHRELQAIHETWSWRLTKPLRTVRRVQFARANRVSQSVPQTATLTTNEIAQGTLVEPAVPLDDGLKIRFRDRVVTVTNLLDPEHPVEAASMEDAILSFEGALDRAGTTEWTKAWLAMVSVFGSYPDEMSLDNAARTYRRSGSRGLTELMLDHLERASRGPGSVESQLEVVDGGVLVDVTHTAAHDLHTGIQRVVREVSSRWLATTDVSVVHWNVSTNSIKRLADDEAQRLREWRTHLHDSGTTMMIRAVDEQTGKTVIPWRSVLVLPELVANPPASSGYRALAKSGVITRCSLIGYDSVPMTATETVNDGMTANFGHYLALVKHSTHLAAISESAAQEFRAFDLMLRSQGLPGPHVMSRPLPTEALDISPDDIERARQEFEVTVVPVVVVVGSHEPRKNHVIVLEAAESMWRSGLKFDLIFAGGSAWGGSMFDSYSRELAAEGFPVRVYERVHERSLWALYRLAEFSVFPSLLEGYGLPIAESLASGTPVITTNFGSMAEIAEGGGAVLVDPRDATDLTSAMTRLLVDRPLRDQLASEARARVFPTWDQYAKSLWADLIES